MLCCLHILSTRWRCNGAIVLNRYCLFGLRITWHNMLCRIYFDTFLFETFIHMIIVQRRYSSHCLSSDNQKLGSVTLISADLVMLYLSRECSSSQNEVILWYLVTYQVTSAFWAISFSSEQHKLSKWNSSLKHTTLFKVLKCHRTIFVIKWACVVTHMGATYESME